MEAILSVLFVKPAKPTTQTFLLEDFLTYIDTVV